MKRTATLLALAGLALSANISQDIQDEEQFAALLARAGIWALSHPQQITKGVEVGIKAVPAVVGGTKKAIDWIQHHDDDELFAQEDDEFLATINQEIQDDEQFAALLARAGIWALSHPQQITKGVEVGIKAAPAVIGGTKKAIDWIQHHDDDDEFFAKVDANIDQDIQDEEQFAALLARAGLWALTHPQQVTKGVEVGIKAVPAVIGGTKKAIDWIQHHDDDEYFAQDDEFFTKVDANIDQNIQDEEQFAALLARAGLWALTHPQQVTKGVEVGIKAVPAVIGGTKKAIDWIQHHDDDEYFAQDDELFVEKKPEVKPKKNGQKLRRNHHAEVEKPTLDQLSDLIKEGHKF